MLDDSCVEAVEDAAADVVVGADSSAARFCPRSLVRMFNMFDDGACCCCVSACSTVAVPGSSLSGPGGGSSSSGVPGDGGELQEGELEVPEDAPTLGAVGGWFEAALGG